MSEREESPEIQKWEYLTVTAELRSGEPEVRLVNYKATEPLKEHGRGLGKWKEYPMITDALTNLGEEGWELVSVLRVSDTVVSSRPGYEYIFKRPKI